MINRKQSLLFLNLQKFKCMETKMYTMCRLNLCVSFCAMEEKMFSTCCLSSTKKGKKKYFCGKKMFSSTKNEKNTKKKNLLNCACNY